MKKDFDSNYVCFLCSMYAKTHVMQQCPMTVALLHMSSVHVHGLVSAGTVSLRGWQRVRPERGHRPEDTGHSHSSFD